MDAGEISVYVIPGSNPLTVAIAGRATVDTSPDLRSVLLGLLRRGTAPVVVIDFSAVSYLDMSGIATLLEVLKVARERSVKLRLTGMGGQAGRSLKSRNWIRSIVPGDRRWSSDEPSGAGRASRDRAGGGCRCIDHAVLVSASETPAYCPSWAPRGAGVRPSSRCSRSAPARFPWWARWPSAPVSSWLCKAPPNCGDSAPWNLW